MTQNRSTAENIPNQRNMRYELDAKVLRQAEMSNILGAVDAEIILTYKIDITRLFIYWMAVIDSSNLAGCIRRLMAILAFPAP